MTLKCWLDASPGTARLLGVSRSTLGRMPDGSMRPRPTEDRITSPLGFARGAAPAFTIYEIRLMRSGMLRRGGVRPADKDGGRPQPARVSDHADVEGRKDPNLLSLRMSGWLGGVPGPSHPTAALAASAAVTART